VQRSRRRCCTDQLARARPEPAAEPRGHSRFAHLRQLPLVCAGWQDDGMDVDGRVTTRSVRDCAGAEPYADSQPGHDQLEHRHARGQIARWFHVAGVAGWEICDVVVCRTRPGHSSTYFVNNFTDYRFLQVFYPTRAFLRITAVPLGAGSHCRRRRSALVQTDGVWSRTASGLCLRARGQGPDPPDIRCRRMPTIRTRFRFSTASTSSFNNGLAARRSRSLASNNGMSNNFPKVSPDGRWMCS